MQDKGVRKLLDTVPAENMTDARIPLSGADYTWPLLPHDATFDLIKALGLQAVDLGFMGNRSHVRPELVRGDTATAAHEIHDRIAARGLAVSDVFAIPWTDFSTMAANNPDSVQQERSLEFFAQAIDFARHVGSPGITTLPGIVFPDESLTEALARAANGLTRRVDMARSAGLSISVEPHIGSLIDTPDKTMTLLDAVPGLQITLDYAHYIYSDAPQSAIDTLLPYARHLQIRPARPGQLQVSVAEDAIDWASVVSQLIQLGYTGYLALEYTWQEWLGCNRVDTVAETALLREVLHAAQADRD